MGLMGWLPKETACRVISRAESREMLSQTYGRFEKVVVLGAALGLGVLFLSGPVQADGPNDAAIAASVKASDAWLPIIDAGKYGESYDGFCVVAKMVLTEDKWVKTNEQVRAPLGKLVSRALKSKQYLSGLPNGTQGQFVILQYETEYANLNATETVTTMLDKDGQWRIAGYYIRPRS
jgi:hypothetical protein